MPLTILIHVSPKDIDRLDSTLSVMEFFGGLQKHTVWFTCSPSIQPRVSEAASRIKAICPNTFVEALPRENEPHGRFGAFNAAFRDSVELLYMRQNKNPWLWMELDLIPIKGGWADRLELEYHQKGLPFMGVRRKASEVMRVASTGQKLDDNDPRAQGDYMVAVGIYPPNFKDFSTMYKYPDPTGNMPTDVSIRHEVNRYLHGTSLIAHHYKTGNYRRENGKLVCDDFQHAEGWPSYAGEVSEMAYLVHGDKTGTLSALILSEMPGNVSTMPQTQTQAAPSAELATLKAQNAELLRDIATMQEQWRVKENSYADEIEKLKEQIESKGGDKNLSHTPQAKVEEPTSGQTVPKIEDVRKAVAESQTKRMLGDWAADFKMDKFEFRKLIESPGSGLVITKPGPPFVKLAA